MPKSKKPLKPEQIEKRIEVFKREMPEVYDNIKMLMEAQGILTKKGTIDKRKKKALEKFQKQFQQQYGGSLTAFKKKQTKKFKEDIVSGLTEARTLKEYLKEKSELNKMVDELFKIDSEQAHQIVVSMNNKTYSEQKEIVKEALDKLKSENDKKEKLKKEAFELNPFEIF